MLVTFPRKSFSISNMENDLRWFDDNDDMLNAETAFCLADFKKKENGQQW